MKNRSYEYLKQLIRNKLYEEFASAAVPPTNCVANGQIAGTPESGQLPPLDFRKKKYKKLPIPYRALFKRKTNVSR